MKLFIDSSSLFKLYHNEPGTPEMDRFFSDNKVTGIIISAITKVEFISAVFKKVRMKELSVGDAEETIKLFDDDLKNYTIIPVDTVAIETSRLLILKYGTDGLRTLDALQLAAALQVSDIVNKYFTADKLLLSLFTKEFLPV